MLKLMFLLYIMYRIMNIVIETNVNSSEAYEKQSVIKNHKYFCELSALIYSCTIVQKIVILPIFLQTKSNK
ncbi:hypothetical protein C8D70_10433 [Chryseobacterium sp. CBTAP 102]|nr:hypothetical protein C8D70_10433 [Chryseobacterium sp. CBTAP 102]